MIRDFNLSCFSALLFLTLILGCKEYENIKAELNNPNAGGDGSVAIQTSDSFSLPNKNITPKHRVDFVVGNALFKENWVPSPSSVESRQGLGPLINAHSCSSCHFKDGRGAPPLSPTEVPIALLVRLSMPGSNKITNDVIPVPHYGDQLQHRSILGVKPEASFFVEYEEIKSTYPDGTPYSLLKPKLILKDLKFGPMPKETMYSARVAPHLVGLGLLEAISESDILANEDPDDKNGDGISGRANWVWDYQQNKKVLGRFGWKANQPNIHQQSAGAFSGDMGITSSLFPEKNCAKIDLECQRAHSIKSLEIPDENLRRVTVYSKTLAVPIRRNLNDEEVLSGAGVFHLIGCAKCHVSSFTTAVDHEFEENSNQKIFPYTDLLLHDMGDDLADHRPDFEASGREWRTPPLWGIGLIQNVNGHTRLLHDGRARSIEEAILWHGGESLHSKNEFLKLPKHRRTQLLKFLEAI